MRSRTFKWLLCALCFLPFLTGTQILRAQEQDGIFLSPVKNSVFLELGGNGLWYSANYERILLNNEAHRIGGRAGLAVLPSDSGSAATLPISASYLFGKGNHNLEVGMGPTFFWAFDGNVRSMAVFGILGYRFQQRFRRGFLFRATVNPFIGEIGTDKGYWNWVLSPWFGLSVGYTW